MNLPFISYSRKDNLFVDRLVQELSQNNISYWRDKDRLPPDKAWTTEIETTLRNGTITHFFYVHSSNSRVSENVLNEIAVAIDVGIPMYVLRLDKSTVPIQVFRNTYIDFYESYDVAIARLLYWLNQKNQARAIYEVPLLSSRILVEPTDSQKAAAHDIHQQIRVIAGPGTGKSFIIEERVRWLLEKGVDPKEIYVVSFTRVASSDLRARVVSYCSAKNLPQVNKIHVTTLHSMALALLRKSKSLNLYSTEPAVLSEWELKILFDEEFHFEYLREFACDVNGKTINERAKEIRRFHEARWSTGIVNPRGIDLPEIEVTEQEKDAFERFYKTFSGVYSVVLPGALINECVSKLKNDTLQLGNYLRIRHFIVDEFQDLNNCDNDFIDAIAKSEQKPFLQVLGDDDQSVYSFRFAYPQGMQNFKNDDRFPLAQDFTLSECFRCTPEILTIASNLIRKNSPTSRLPKDLVPHYRNVPSVVRRMRFRSEQREATFIAESCKKLVDAGINPDDILILVYSGRTQRQPLEEAFNKINGLGANFISSSSGYYFEDEWVQFLYALTRVVCDTVPKDYVGHRILLGSLPGVGTGTCTNIKNKVVEANLNYLELFYLPLPAKVFKTREENAIKRVSQIIELIKEWKPDDTLSLRINDINALIESNSQDPEAKTTWLELYATLPEAMTLNELRDFIGSQNSEQIRRVLSGSYKRLEIDEGDTPFLKPRIRIMTMHGAKGLNAKIVFIPGLENAIIPGSKRLDNMGLIYEAARLLYVSITRASAACFFTYASSRMLGKERQYNRPESQFLQYLGGRFVDSDSSLSDYDVNITVQTITKLEDAGYAVKESFRGFDDLE